jgi:hypothetical protein
MRTSSLLNRNLTFARTNILALLGLMALPTFRFLFKQTKMMTNANIFSIVLILISIIQRNKFQGRKEFTEFLPQNNVFDVCSCSKGIGFQNLNQDICSLFQFSIRLLSIWYENVWRAKNCSPWVIYCRSLIECDKSMHFLKQLCYRNKYDYVYEHVVSSLSKPAK